MADQKLNGRARKFEGDISYEGSFMDPLDSVKYLVKAEIRETEIKWLGKVIWFGGIMFVSIAASLVAVIFSIITGGNAK